jgi:insertion element IS1 protein InsB
MRDACPGCGSKQFKKNGHIHNGKQNHQRKACGRQFVLHAENPVIAEGHRTLVERLLREKISLRGICRALVSRSSGSCTVWPAVSTPRPIICMSTCRTSLTAVIVRRLEAEADEMCGFVGKRANTLWIWPAMEARTRQVIAFHVGDRGRNSAERLWTSIPAAYREQARFYTDQYGAYTGGIPAVRHKAITKKARKTNHIERFNNTLRQRVTRLGRDTLAFSKKLAIISEPSNISSAPTISPELQHYMDNTTLNLTMSDDF